MLPYIAGIAALIYIAALHYGTHVTIERFAMSVQDQIDAVVAQLAKAKDEIVGKLEEATAGVEAQFVAAGVENPDLSALTAIAQALDDLVPDAAEVEEVVEETTEAVDEPVEVETDEDESTEDEDDKAEA